MQPSYRISTTTLESYRLFRTSDWFTHEMFVERLTSPFIENEAMRVGSAFHKLLEERPAENVCNGYEFIETPNAKLTEALNLIPAGVPELKIAKLYMSDFGMVQIVAQADLLHGNCVHEYKTSSKSIDIGKYEKSLQWQIYMDIFEADQFKYWLFKLVKDRGNEKKYIVQNYLCPTFYRFKGMHKNITNNINGYLQTIHDLDLTSHLRLAA